MKVNNNRHVYNVIGQLSANPTICNMEIRYTVGAPFAATGAEKAGWDSRGSASP